MFDPVWGQESRLPKFITLQARSKNRQYLATTLVCLFLCHFLVLLSFPSLFARRIFSLCACLYYFFALLLLPLFCSPLCFVDCLSLSSLLFPSLFEIRVSGFEAPTTRVSQTLSQEGEETRDLNYKHTFRP